MVQRSNKRFLVARTHAGMTRNDTSPSNWRASLSWSVLLSLLFLVVYGGCNWITSRRSDVGVIQFEWERAIPLIPAMIIPYMSIDLFFVAAPFLCRRSQALHTLVARIGSATIVAGACFLFMPLQMAEERPEFSGFFGVIHDLLKAGDRPYNLFPSLHVTYLLTLWAVYGHYLRGLAAALLHVWFSLVLVSVLFVYQHHVIDMAGGAALAIACFYTFPAKRPPKRAERASVVTGPRTGAIYLLWAGVLAAVSYGTGGWGLIGLWPVVSLVLVAAAYFGLGPAIFRKADGQIPLSVRWVLGPHLGGLFVSRLWYWRTDRPYHEVVATVILGRRLSERASRAVIGEGVTAVLDMTAEHAAAPALRGMPYLNVQVLDLTVPTVKQLGEAVNFIAEHAARGVVFVYCGLGYSRSAAAVAGYLLACGAAENVEDACTKIRLARPRVVFKPDLLAVLEAYNQTLP